MVKELSKSDASINTVFSAAVVLGSAWHDIGKKFVPTEVLRSSNKLTEPEFSVMKQHSQLGFDFFKTVKSDYDLDTQKIISDVILYHHERYDGSGYPAGLMGSDIPLSARIVAVTDVFEALNSSCRTYKCQYSFEQSKTTIVEGRGTLFDPIVVDAFLAIASEWEKILYFTCCPGKCT